MTQPPFGPRQQSFGHRVFGHRGFGGPWQQPQQGWGGPAPQRPQPGAPVVNPYARPGSPQALLPAPGQPRRPAPPASGPGGALVLVLALALVVGMLGIGFLSRPRRSQVGQVAPTSEISATQRPGRESTPSSTDSEPAPQPPTSEPPSPAPSSRMPRTERGSGIRVLPQRHWDALPAPHTDQSNWSVLQRNRLYDQQIPVGECPRAEAPFTDAQHFRRYVTQVIDCQHAAWKPLFTRMGKELPRPRVVFVDGAVQTPCGRSGEEVSFYCGLWDGSSYTLYMHSGLREETNSWWRLRAFETTAHEFAHHVQMMAGILYNNAILVRDGGMDELEGSRRVELQVSCLVGRILVATPATGFTAKDHQTYLDWSSAPQDDMHGSVPSTQYWWQRGLYMDTVGGCNTFTVPATRVS